MIKFFKRNKLDSTATMTATTANTALMVNLYDNDPSTKLVSIGSSDSAPEVWEFTFTGARSVDAIQVANHNIKAGKIEYWNGSAYVDFSAAIAWSANTASSNYFAFTQVSTTKIRVTMNTTIVANAQKYIGELRFLEAYGALLSNPSKIDIKYAEKTKDFSLDNGAAVQVFFGEQAEIKLKFDALTQADVDILRGIKNTRTLFYCYPNGGNNTASLQEGLRIGDMYFVVWSSDFQYKLPSGHLTDTVVGMDITLKEAV
jgi:hypothetical protein